VLAVTVAMASVPAYGMRSLGEQLEVEGCTSAAVAKACEVVEHRKFGQRLKNPRVINDAETNPDKVSILDLNIKDLFQTKGMYLLDVITDARLIVG